MEEMSFKSFWLRAIGGTLLCKYFEVEPLVKDEMLFEELWRPSCSMEQNHCGHLGFLTDTILACFDPEVILLLKSKLRLKAI